MMKYFAHYILIMVICLLSCAEDPPTNVVKPAFEQSSATHNWDGTYVGEDDCPDCEAVHTHLTLRLDRTYTRQVIHQGSSKEPSVERGSFTLSADGKTLALDADMDPMRYRLDPGLLTPIDADGSVISNKHPLKMSVFDTQLEGKYWRLETLHGTVPEPVTQLEAPRYIILGDKGTFIGQGDRGLISGTFETRPLRQIRFDLPDLTAQKDLPPAVVAQLKDELSEALAQVTKYEVADDILKLYSSKGGAPIATFKVVYLR